MTLFKPSVVITLISSFILFVSNSGLPDKFGDFPSVVIEGTGDLSVRDVGVRDVGVRDVGVRDVGVTAASCGSSEKYQKQIH